MKKLGCGEFLVDEREWNRDKVLSQWVYGCGNRVNDIACLEEYFYNEVLINTKRNLLWVCRPYKNDDTLYIELYEFESSQEMLHFAYLFESLHYDLNTTINGFHTRDYNRYYLDDEILNIME